MNKVTVILFIIICIYSCSKAPSTSVTPGRLQPTKTLLQNKWNLISIIIYANRDFTGANFFAYSGSAADYYDFRGDGRLYSHTSFFTDTSTYKLLNDDSTILTYTGPNYGAGVAIPDTAIIRSVTFSDLILYHRTKANEHGKMTLKKF